MSKKLLVLTLVLVGAFASMAGAQVSIDDTKNPWFFSYGGASSIIAPFNMAGTVLNPEGKGDLLIFPYYETRKLDGKAQQTVFAIINEGLGTTNGGVAAKLRFREWDKSVEVFDIDIWLSINDVWIGTISQSAGGSAQLSTPDWVIIDYDDCFFELKKAFVDGEGGPVEFATFNLPKGSTNLYGYFEVIGEELTDPEAKTANGTTTVLRKCFLYESDYVYSDCPNTLMGYAYIVRLEDGVGLGYTATAIANFYKSDVTIECNGPFGCFTAIDPLFAGPGSQFPRMDAGQDTLDAIEFNLSKAYLYVPYALETSIKGATTQLITFPTKHFHFADKAPWSIITKFDSNKNWGMPFTGTTSNTGEEVIVRLFDRNEKEDKTPTFTSPQPEAGKISLPFELMLIGFYKGSSTPVGRANLGFSTKTFESGWTRWDLMFKTESGSPDPVLNHYAFPHLIWDKFGYGAGIPECTGFNYWDNEFMFYGGLPAIVYTIAEASVGEFNFFGEMIPTPYENSWGLGDFCDFMPHSIADLDSK